MNYKQIAKSVFPDYRGWTIRLNTDGKVTFCDTNWGGGTCNKYKCLRLSDLKTAVYNAPAPWCNPVEGKTVEIPEGYVIFEHSIFCGKDTGITVYLPKQNILTEVNS